MSKLSGNAKLAVVTPRSKGHNSVTSVHADDVEKLIEFLTIKSRNGFVREVFNQEFYYFCIFSSSGLTHDGCVNFGSTRQIELAPGEHHINDIALNEDGTALYSAAGNVVRVWDLKR